MTRKAPSNAEELCACGHKRVLHLFRELECRSGCDCQKFRSREEDKAEAQAKRRSLKYIASWRDTNRLGYSVSLTASGRVIQHHPGGKSQLSSFSARWLDRPEDMIRIVESTLEDGYVRVAH